MTANHSWTGVVAVLGENQEADAAAPVSSSRIIAIMMAQKLFQKKREDLCKANNHLSILS